MYLNIKKCENAYKNSERRQVVNADVFLSSLKITESYIHIARDTSKNSLFFFFFSFRTIMYCSEQIRWETKRSLRRFFPRTSNGQS